MTWNGDDLLVGNLFVGLQLWQSNLIIDYTYLFLQGQFMMFRVDSSSRDDITEVTFSPLSRLFLDQDLSPKPYYSLSSLSQILSLGTQGYLRTIFERVNKTFDLAFFIYSSFLALSTFSAFLQGMRGRGLILILGICCSQRKELFCSQMIKGTMGRQFTTDSSTTSSGSYLTLLSMTSSSMSSQRLIIFSFVSLTSFAVLIICLLLDYVFLSACFLQCYEAGKSRLYLGLTSQLYSIEGYITVCDLLSWADISDQFTSLQLLQNWRSFLSGALGGGEDSSERCYKISLNSFMLYLFILANHYPNKQFYTLQTQSPFKLHTHNILCIYGEVKD